MKHAGWIQGCFAGLKRARARHQNYPLHQLENLRSSFAPLGPIQYAAAWNGANLSEEDSLLARIVRVTQCLTYLDRGEWLLMSHD